MTRTRSKDIIRAKLKARGFKVTVRDRELTCGQKYFFVVEDEEGGLWETSNSIRSLIKEHFPRAHLSSGGSHSRTYAEY